MATITSLVLVPSWTDEGSNIYSFDGNYGYGLVYNGAKFLTLATDSSCADGEYYSAAGNTTYYVKSVGAAPVGVYISDFRNGCFFSSKSNITLDCINIFGCYAAVYVLHSSAPVDNITIKDCNLSSSNYGTSFNAAGSLTQNNMTVIDNSISECSEGIALISTDNGTSPYVNTLISGNTITYTGSVNNNTDLWVDVITYVTDNEAIGVQSVQNSLIKENNISGGINTAVKGLVMFHPATAATHSNEVKDNSIKGVAKGITISGATGVGMCYDNIIKNNVISNCATFCMEYYDSSGVSGKETLFANNTLYGQAHQMFLTRTPTDSYFKFINNIVYSTSSNILVSFNETGGTPNKILDYNSYYADVSLKFKEGSTEYTTLAAWKIQSTQEAHSIDTDPLLNSSYKLRSSSPCIDAGTTIAGVTEYYYGSAVDIGFSEYTGSGKSGFLGWGLRLGSLGISLDKTIADGSYWTTARTNYWDIARTVYWTETRNTEAVIK